MNSKEFSLLIEAQRKEMPDMSYMECILHYCEQNNIEPETVGKLISKALKEKISIECQKLNLLEKTAVLPL
tara:strand:+ start:459 stop:671 length:213 start_codon:yes stop_codon:yes gene_type:complete